MFNYIWPLALVVLSNVFYHICTKSAPESMDPFASLTVTYAIGAVFSAILFFVINKGGNIIGEYGKLNWAPVVLGLSIVGLEAGWIYAYKAGWPVSVGNIVQSAVLAIVLIFVGYIVFREGITWNKIVGVLICLVGLGVINFK